MIHYSPNRTKIVICKVSFLLKTEIQRNKCPRPFSHTTNSPRPAKSKDMMRDSLNVCTVDSCCPRRIKLYLHYAKLEKNKAVQKLSKTKNCTMCLP